MDQTQHAGTWLPLGDGPAPQQLVAEVVALAAEPLAPIRTALMGYQR